MLTIAIFLVCFFASAVGAVCGIGGGIIIKPVLDSLGTFHISVINFLSSCTVLSMAAYSVLRSRRDSTSHIELSEAAPLAFSSAAGGAFGNRIFHTLQMAFATPEYAGACQTVLLAAVLVFTLLYSIKKSSIKTLHIKAYLPKLAIGFSLGCTSSFLGIGGGPFNLAVLSFFFSMGTKKAAENSLFIIFFSQIANLLSAFVTGTVPEFSFSVMLLMASGGVLGGVFGRRLNKIMNESHIDLLFNLLLAGLLCLDLYNFAIYAGVY